MGWEFTCNCIHFANRGKCAHPDSRSLFGRTLACVFISDKRAGTCVIQVEHARPTPPPPPPVKP